ncbi:hypothetical protein T484DRAFT_1755063 [Baffinella frigidus]|nr:hypothetical protein T484DRAFT_1755063 [Cryptophyta sp. CCMP2293]
MKRFAPTVFVAFACFATAVSAQSKVQLPGVKRPPPAKEVAGEASYYTSSGEEAMDKNPNIPKIPYPVRINPKTGTPAIDPNTGFPATGLPPYSEFNPYYPGAQQPWTGSPRSDRLLAMLAAYRAAGRTWPYMVPPRDWPSAENPGPIPKPD